MRLLTCLAHGFCRPYPSPCQHCAIAAVLFTLDLETVADSISNAFVAVVEAADVRCATANTEALDTPHDALDDHANVDPISASRPSIPFFSSMTFRISAEGTDVTEDSDASSMRRCVTSNLSSNG